MKQKKSNTSLQVTAPQYSCVAPLNLDIMRLKPAISFLFAVLLGAAVGVAIMLGYALPGILPAGGLFMFILDSPLGHFALQRRGSEGGLFIAIAIRAFPYSVVAGVVAGMMIRKIRFKRAFCYSALWVPLGNILLGYLAVSTTVSNVEGISIIHKNFGLLVWKDLCVYGWYFIALYISSIVTNRITLRSSGTPACDSR